MKFLQAHLEAMKWTPAHLAAAMHDAGLTATEPNLRRLATQPGAMPTFQLGLDIAATMGLTIEELESPPKAERAGVDR
jgi:hypothetical protein